jgi:hypothetical protein
MEAIPEQAGSEAIADGKSATQWGAKLGDRLPCQEVLIVHLCPQEFVSTGCK